MKYDVLYTLVAVRIEAMFCDIDDDRDFVTFVDYKSSRNHKPSIREDDQRIRCFKIVPSDYNCNPRSSSQIAIHHSAHYHQHKIKIHLIIHQKNPTAMADHPLLIDLQTTAQILHQTNVIFSTGHNLCTFLVLSFLLFSLRDSVENVTQFITTSIDNDPYIESILSRSQLPPNSTTSKRHRHRHHHRPNWAVLDNGFLSIDQDGRIFENIVIPKENDTSLILNSFSPHLGYSKFISDNGIRASEVVRPGVRFSYRPFKIVEKEDNVIMNSTNGSTSIDPGKTKSKKDLHQETKRLLFKIGAICASFCFMIIASIVIDIWSWGCICVGGQ
ncbi:hypothetical protein R6Q59_011496 [Mikania micrantha]